MDNNIYLIGFMGTGKSTVGKQMAEKLGWNHIDTDDVIEDKYKMSIPKVFEKFGEDSFRRLENQVISDLSAKSRNIVSTGGGTPIYHGNIDIMKDSGLVIHLETSTDILWKRLKGLGGRPILKIYDTFEKFNRLYLDRKTVYDMADMIINIGERSVIQVVDECIDSIFYQR